MAFRLAARRSRAGVLCLPGMLFASGCYKYTPIVPAQAPLSSPVRAYLSPPAGERLETVLTPGQRYLQGRLLQRDAERFLLEVPVPRLEDLVPDRGLVQRIPITPDEVVSMEIRTLDRTRTALFAGVLATAGGLLLAQVLSGDAGGGAYPPPDDGGLGETVVLLFAIRR